jgi:hypothetical protein
MTLSKVLLFLTLVFEDGFSKKLISENGLVLIVWLGRYSFSLPEIVVKGELRPLRDLADGEQAENLCMFSVPLPQTPTWNPLYQDILGS